jgi:hypothetical protein
MRTLTAIAVAAIMALAHIQPATAWGLEVHRFIMEQAIPLLPPEIRPFFERHRTYLVEHAVDPDLWRNAGFEEEPPRHFVDMDAYGPYPFKELPRDYEQAVKRYGQEFVVKNGTLPWRAEEIYKKLVEAFTQKGTYSRENIKFFAAAISHYTADAHVPFHAALNYDGQLTGQWGIHSRFESELFDRYRQNLTIAPKPIAAVPNAREFMFDSLLAGFPLVQPILDADREAVKGREVYDDGYFTLFFGKVKPTLERRLSESITDVASIITAAWVEAGRPALPLDAPRTPRKVRRQ